MAPAASDPTEVWLRGNRRVAAILGVAALALDGLAAAAAATAAVGGGGAAWWVVAGVATAAASGLFLLAWASARPRLLREGDRLLVQVSPFVRETVPIDIVECVFPGSHPLDAAGAPSADTQAVFRVGTIILRLAERALEYRSRDTFAAWVTWHDGTIVFDGRWCEPLSPTLARNLGSRLIDVKRSIAADGSP